ncbi:MAG: hypothetical protein ACRDBO_16745 [Lachnospiraceae bacterium]
MTGTGRSRTAVLEWNRHDDFGRMREICINDTRDRSSFRILDVDYYAQADAGVWMDCVKQGYRRIILDCGVITEKSLYECVRCDKTVVVGSLAEWQIGSFLEFLDVEGRPDAGWTYAAVFGSDEARRKLQKRFGRNILRIPFSVDAFTISRADMDFFVSLLK